MLCHACYERRRRRGAIGGVGGLRGREHGNWNPEPTSKHVGRSQARNLYTAPSECERCGASRRLDRHHKDANPLNNERSNIAFLCRRCHQEVDGRLDAARTRLSALSVPQEPKSCGVCGRPYKPLRRGRCSPCYQFFRKHGRDSPPAGTRKRTSTGEPKTAHR